MNRLLPISLFFCLGCSSAPKAPLVKVSPVNNNHSVKFSGLDYAIIGEISRDSVAGIWQRIIPVFRMPADTGMKDYQHAQPGVYQLKDSAVVFTPDTPFVKNGDYFVRYYQFGKVGGAWGYIRGKAKLGKTRYMDLIFKP